MEQAQTTTPTTGEWHLMGIIIRTRQRCNMGKCDKHSLNNEKIGVIVFFFGQLV